jgi:hypothetical protein
MMKTASNTETSANFYQTTLRNFPEDSHLHTRRREYLKSQTVIFIDRRSLDIVRWVTYVPPSKESEIASLARLGRNAHSSFVEVNLVRCL